MGLQSTNLPVDDQVNEYLSLHPSATGRCDGFYRTTRGELCACGVEFDDSGFCAGCGGWVAKRELSPVSDFPSDRTVTATLIVASALVSVAVLILCFCAIVAGVK